MADVQLGLEFDDGGALDAFAKVQTRALETDAIMQRVSKTANDTFEGLRDDILATDKAQQQNIETIGKQKTAMVESERQNRNWRSVVRGMANDVNIFGVNLGGVIGQLENKKKALSGNITNIRGLAGAFGKLKIAIAATGIGLLLVALGSLAALLQRNQKAIDFVERAMSGLGAAIDVIIDRAAVLGGAIVKLFSGDFVGAAADAKAAISGVTDELREEISLAQQLTGELQKLEKREQLLNIQRAQARSEIKQLNLIAEDTTKSLTERANAARQAGEIERKLLEDRNRIAEGYLANQLGQLEFNEKTKEVLNEIRQTAINTDAGLAQFDKTLGSLGLSNSTITDFEEFTRVVEEYYRGQQESLELQTTLQNKLNTIEREAAAKRKATLEAEQKAVEKLQTEYSQLIEDLDSRLQSAELDNLTGVERIEREREIAQAQINELERVAKERAAQLGKAYELDEKFGALRAATNTKFEQEITALQIEETKKRIEAQKKELDERQQAQQTYFDDQIALIDQREAVQIAEVELIQETADKVLSLEETKEKKRLEIQRAALEERRAFFVEFYGENSLEVQLIDAQIGAINNKLGNVGKGFESVFDNVKNAILKGLNIDEEELSFLVENVLALGGAIADSFKNGVDEAIQQQERLIASLDDQINATDEAVSREFELKKQGLANNYELEKQNLEKLEQERALAEQRKVALEKKAARQSILANSAAQASELVLAATKIMGAHANIPFAGIAIGLGFLGVLVSTINKLKAANTVRLFTGGRIPLNGKDDRFGQGHRIEGTNIEVGAGEWVMKRTVSDEHDAFLAAMNADRFKGIDLVSVTQKALHNDPVSVSVSAITDLEKQSNPSGVKVVTTGGGVSEETLQKAVDKAIGKHIDRLIADQRKRPDRIPLRDGQFYEIVENENGVVYRKVTVN